LTICFPHEREEIIASLVFIRHDVMKFLKNREHGIFVGPNEYTDFPSYLKAAQKFYLRGIVDTDSESELSLRIRGDSDSELSHENKGDSATVSTKVKLRLPAGTNSNVQISVPPVVAREEKSVAPVVSVSKPLSFDEIQAFLEDHQHRVIQTLKAKKASGVWEEEERPPIMSVTLFKLILLAIQQENWASVNQVKSVYPGLKDLLPAEWKSASTVPEIDLYPAEQDTILDAGFDTRPKLIAACIFLKKNVHKLLNPDFRFIVYRGKRFDSMFRYLEAKRDETVQLLKNKILPGVNPSLKVNEQSQQNEGENKKPELSQQKEGDSKKTELSQQKEGDSKKTELSQQKEGDSSTGRMGVSQTAASSQGVPTPLPLSVPPVINEIGPSLVVSSQLDDVQPANDEDNAVLSSAELNAFAMLNLSPEQLEALKKMVIHNRVKKS
jgi:hypothetical protein